LKEFLRHHSQTIIILLIWTIAGVIAKPIALFLVPLMLVLLKLRQRYKEIFFGLIYLCILSDNRISAFFFAKDVKELYFVMMGAFLVFDRKLFAPFNKFVYPFIGFFIIALLCSFFYPDDATVSIQKLFSYFLLYLVGPNYIAMLYKNDPRNFINFFVYFIISLLTISLVLYIPYGEILSIGGRYSGVLGNPNALGLFSTIFLCALFVIIDLEPKLFSANQKRFFLIVILLNIILCRSRTSLISVSMFLIFTATFKRSSMFGFITVILFFIANTYIIDIAEVIAVNFGLEDYFRLKDIEKGSGRLIAWAFGWQVIQEQSFFLGKGFNFTSYNFDLNLERLALLGHQGNAHNSYITFWIDTGLIGLLLFMYGFVNSFLRANKFTKLALPAMFTFGFSMFFESWFCAALNPYIIQVIFIIVLAQLPRIADIEKEKELESVTENEQEQNLALA